jgi:trehalose 6-phosphate phosphatase
MIAHSLCALASDPGSAALLLDVDGTLAPIVARPEDAAVPPETRRELGRLGERYALVACVSGRTAADAERVVGVPGLVYVGEHGLELEPEAWRWAGRIAAFADSAEWPSERKPLTVAFHYRTAREPEAARAALSVLADRAAAAGLDARWGRMVLEIRPPVHADKGTAVRCLLAERELARALYAGDDTTDVDAFRALEGLELGVRVAVASDEGPAELRSAADIVVRGPGEFLTLLRRL